MSDRRGFQFPTTLVPSVKHVDGYFLCTTSGTIRNSQTDGYTDGAGQVIYYPRGIKSCVRNSTGNYTITFGNASTGGTSSYIKLLSCSIMPVCPVATDIKAQVVSTNYAAGGLRSTISSVVIQFVTVGTAADIPSNGGFYVHFAFADSAGNN